jgi:formate C-acetyltransferase
MNVRDFINKNYTPYDGDGSFLAKPSQTTVKLWGKVLELMKKERENNGVLDIDTKTISDVNVYEAGYIDRELETIVGLQTSEPLKRAIMPFGGIRMVEGALKTYGYDMDEGVEEVFKYRKTHNDGVFDVYTEEMLKARKSGIITGLPDAYGRGRIIGDYRRVALYGVDKLIQEKQDQLKSDLFKKMNEKNIRLREELAEQIRALEKLKDMAREYGFDISIPAKDTKEAIQWVYFGYLGAVKEQNGAAMSLGRISTFLDIYAKKDLDEGRYNEEKIQEFIDHFVMKLRMVRFLRTPDYDALFSGDPVWVTEVLGGIGKDGRHMVTKMTYRFLNTLTNLGPAPEPNMTVLWSDKLPETFKRFCSEMSIKTSSIQYENDDIMRDRYGDDYGIACCVSAMEIGKQMQFFGARANLAKALLYAINGGVDEISGVQVGPKLDRITSEYLEYNEVMNKFEKVCEWLADLYVNTLNAIHYMHDKYCYEKIEMALHDANVERFMACGVAGLSVVADSLSAIKTGGVKVIRNAEGIAIDYEVTKEYPKYGNNLDEVDSIAVEIVNMFMDKIRNIETYRESIPSMSILTITSNVVYGKKTGSTPDGRKHKEPFAPGANPMHGRDKNGSLASMASVAKIDYENAQDGISYTYSVIPEAIGKTEEDRINNLANLLDGYFNMTGHHINVNVLSKELLRDAMVHPDKYPQLTVRVSGYAVNFIKLTKEQQEDVISRTFHERV